MPLVIFNKRWSFDQTVTRYILIWRVHYRLTVGLTKPFSTFDVPSLSTQTSLKLTVRWVWCSGLGISSARRFFTFAERSISTRWMPTCRTTLGSHLVCLGNEKR